MKKIIVIGTLLIISASLITGCGCKKKEEKKEDNVVKSNTNEEVIKDQKIETFEFTNTSLVYINGTSSLETKVKNNSDKEAYLKEFKIHIKGKDGKEIIELTGFVGSKLKAGEERILTSNCGMDITNAASIEYEIVK